MEVDEIQREVRKFQRISSNGSPTSDNNSSNPKKIATQFTAEDDGAAARLCGWPASRIIRVSRASGGKDRHSKVLTSKGLRDRRVRLSVNTAIQFYDLQDRLGYDQPSKAVEWLIKAAATSIAELPSLHPSFPASADDDHHQQNVSVSKSPAGSSTSENSKGSGLSLSRSENRIRARERARDMVAKKEKGQTRAAVVNNPVNGISQNSSFTDLLTGGISSTAVSPAASPDSRIHWTTTPMDYLFNRPPPIQMPQFNITGAGDNHPQYHHFSFLQENFAPAVTTTAASALNFSIASSSSSPGFNRGTLQSNLSSILPHHNHLQRFQSSSMADGSTSTNFPFFAAPPPEHFYGAGDGGGRHSDHQKEKSKN